MNKKSKIKAGWEWGGKNNSVFNNLKFEMSNGHSSVGTEQLDMSLEFRKRVQG